MHLGQARCEGQCAWQRDPLLGIWRSTAISGMMEKRELCELLFIFFSDILLNATAQVNNNEAPNPANTWPDSWIHSYYSDSSLAHFSTNLKSSLSPTLSLDYIYKATEITDNGSPEFFDSQNTAGSNFLVKLVHYFNAIQLSTSRRFGTIALFEYNIKDIWIHHNPRERKLPHLAWSQWFTSSYSTKVSLSKLVSAGAFEFRGLSAA